MAEQYFLGPRELARAICPDLPKEPTYTRLRIHFGELLDGGAEIYYSEDALKEMTTRLGKVLSPAVDIVWHYPREKHSKIVAEVSKNDPLGPWLGMAMGYTSTEAFLRDIVAIPKALGLKPIESLGY
ncbi:MAG: hypothetical protein JW727_05905 [Candidatus Aenigmarchaeota archaeon]|nr:hypothetical protein [Candidatus Aenigmarchaeota archaeon]